MKFNDKKYQSLKFQARVCVRCGYADEAKKLELEAQEMLNDYIRFLDRQAGITRE